MKTELSQLNITVDIRIIAGRPHFCVSGESTNGGSFAKELQWPDYQKMPLTTFEQFLLETKYEALHPPRYNIQDWGPQVFELAEDVKESYPGLDNNSFEIVINTNKLIPGDRIAPEDLADRELVVQDFGRTVEPGWHKYLVRQFQLDRNVYFPLHLLNQGHRFVLKKRIYSE